MRKLYCDDETLTDIGHTNTAETRVPATYAKAFALVDANSTGETSLSSLHRVVATSGIPASTIDRVRGLVACSDRL